MGELSLAVKGGGAVDILRVLRADEREGASQRVVTQKFIFFFLQF